MYRKIFQLSLFFLMFLTLDYSIFKIFDLKGLNFSDIFFVNIFLFILTLLFFLIYKWLLKIKTKSPFTYLSLSFFKMVISLIFLYPIYTNFLGNAIPYILHFFILYFLYLFMEIMLLIKDSR